MAGPGIHLHESVWDKFLDEFLPRVRSLRIGDPLDEKTQMGPLTSKDHQKRVLEYVDVAKGEGAEILYGGRRPDTPETSRRHYGLPAPLPAEDPPMRVRPEEGLGALIT